jgi:hypothetical protein
MDATGQGHSFHQPSLASQFDGLLNAEPDEKLTHQNRYRSRVSPVYRQNYKDARLSPPSVLIINPSSFASVDWLNSTIFSFSFSSDTSQS